MRIKLWSTVRYMFFLVVFILLACEIILRVYNPFPFRLKGSDILLPGNQRYLIKNTGLPGVDSVVIHTKNAIGLRGPEMPADLKPYFSVIVVGGSTTECWRQEEKKSWPFLLGQKLENNFQPVWLNNAGFSGLSSWAHYLLINQYIKTLHPRVLFLLVGWNEVARPELLAVDDLNGTHNHDWRSFLGRHSEVYNLVVNIKRHHQYKEYGKETIQPILMSRDHPLIFNSRRHDDSLVQAEGASIRLYKKRLNAIVDTCRSNGITPILITQPGILGNGIDPQTGCNLDDYRLYPDFSGKLFSNVLKLYNKTTVETAKEKGVFYVDLANLLEPKSENYYDICHYSNKGCQNVAQIIYDQSIDYLKLNFTSYLKR